MSRLLKNFSIIFVVMTFLGCSQETEVAAQNNAPQELNQQAPVVSEPIATQATLQDPSADSSSSEKKDSSDAFNLDKVKDTYQNVNFQISDISERSYDGGNAIAITFSVPLNPSDNFSRYLQVSGKGGVVNGSWVLSESGKVAYFEFIQPNSKYHVEVDWHLASALGQKLAATETGTVNTRQVLPSVSFASTGHFLPLDLHSGLPVTVLNVPEVSINFHRIKGSEIPYVVRLLADRHNQSQYQLKRMADAGELVHSGRYQLPAGMNKRKTFNIPLHEVPALRESGLYVAVMQKPGTYDNPIQATYFSVTDLGIHIRRYAQSITVHANSLKTTKALENVYVTLLSDNGSELAKKSSNKLGEAVFNTVNTSAKYLVASYQNSYTIVSLKKAALDLSDFDLGKRPFNSQELFIYSERDLYRPGDTVNFNALLRDFDGKKTRSTPLKAKIKRADGQVLKEFSWHPNKQSYYEYSYLIDKTAQVGKWQLEVSGLSKKKTRYEFKVEEFMPERLKLSFDANKQSPEVFNSKQDVVVPILGEYLYGAPAAGNRLDARIKIDLLRHPFEVYKDFYFGSELETQWNDNFEENNGEMDDEGKLTLNIPSRWQQTKSPLSVSVFASLYESGGRPISRKHVSKVLPSKGVIGIRPVFKEYAPARGQAEFELIKTNASEEKLASSNLDVVLVREDRRYFWEYSHHEGWHYEYTEKELVELSTSSKIELGKLAKLELPVDYGRYRLEVTDTDTGYKSTMKFTAGNDWYGWWRDSQKAGQAARPDKVTLTLDKPSYAAGESIELTLIPPAAGESIIVVESDKPLWSHRLTVPKEGMKVSIPVNEKWNRHDIYISVVHLQPADNLQKITPTRSFGLVHLPLNREDKKLSIEFDAPEKWLPNQQVELKLKVSSGDESQPKKADKAWVTVAAVDVGILNITDYQTPDPHEFFFGKRRYDIDSLDMYNDLIELNANPLAKQRFGGDAGGLSRGGKQAQSEVQIVSLFSGLIEVKNGEANVMLELPDFNGRIKLMAVAFTEDSVSSSEQEVIVAAPLVTQLSIPRFVAWGDESTIALDLNNLSGSSQTLNVSLTSSGAVVLKEFNESIVIKDKTKKTISLPINVGYKGETSTINLNVEGVDDYPISRQWKLNSRSAYPAITMMNRKVLKEDESLHLAAETFTDYIPETLQASLSASNLVDLEMRNQMDNLLRYPYGCLEQSTSSTYPWVYASEQVLNNLDLKNTTGHTPAYNIENGLERIIKKQKKNGGFGLWSNNDNDEQHWLGAYVGDFLTDARQQGFQVNDEFYNKTMKRLGDYLKNNSSYSARWTEKPEHYRFAYRAYAGYVLSRHNKAGLGHLRKLADRYSDSQSFLPLIHLGLALHNQGDLKKGSELLDKALSDIRRGNFYLGDYGSSIRDKALAIHLLTRHKLKPDETFNIAIELAQEIKTRHYLSTQERNALFLAGLALETGTHKAWKADLHYADVVSEIKASGNRSQFLQGKDIAQGITLTNRSSELLYSTLAYSGFSKQAPQVESDKGIKIERNYFNLKGEEIVPSQLNVGDMVLVALKVNTERRMPDLMVVDLLPAGLELENQNLKHAAKFKDLVIDGHSISRWQERSKILHEEYRDDRYVAAIDVNWQKEVYGFYLARAVTPGKYQVPAPFAEDMYSPDTYAIGSTLEHMIIK